MWQFRTPDIEKLKEKQDVKGLIRALRHRNRSVRDAAAAALAEFEDAPDVQAILSEMREWRKRMEEDAEYAVEESRIAGGPTPSP